MKQALLVLLAVGACVLLCSPQVADAACCLTGQPTYTGSEVRFEGIPTCSDGPCSGSGFNYLKRGAFESPNAEACCDRKDTNGFYYNPQSGKGFWPDIEKFPQKFDGTSRECDANVAMFRCGLGGQETRARRFSLKRFI